MEGADGAMNALNRVISWTMRNAKLRNKAILPTVPRTPCETQSLASMALTIESAPTHAVRLRRYYGVRERRELDGEKNEFCETKPKNRVGDHKNADSPKKTNPNEPKRTRRPRRPAPVTKHRRSRFSRESHLQPMSLTNDTEDTDHRDKLTTDN